MEVTTQRKGHSFAPALARWVEILSDRVGTFGLFAQDDRLSTAVTAAPQSPQWEALSSNYDHGIMTMDIKEIRDEEDGSGCV